MWLRCNWDFSITPAEILGDLGSCQLAGGDEPAARATLERAHAMAPVALLPRARLALAKLSPTLAPALLAQALDGFTRRGDTGGAAEARRLLRKVRH